MTIAALSSFAFLAPFLLVIAAVLLLVIEERRDALDHERDLIFRFAPKHNRQHAPETFTPSDLGLNGAA